MKMSIERPAPRSENTALRPRIAPLPEAGEDPQVRSLLAGWGLAEDAAVPKIFATLARHPELLAQWDSLQRALLLHGALPERDRELLILRTALNCRSAYIWGQHVSHHGPAAGLTAAEMARIPAGVEDQGWEPADLALLRAADELHADAAITEPTWRELAGGYDDRQLIELPVVVGEYHLMAFLVNVLGVEPEPGVSDLPPEIN